MADRCPAASIVIRAKNEEALIGETLAKVYGQKFRSFEVIVVDSGSTDRTLAIARRFPARVIEIPSKTFTYGGALNTGCRAAHGEFVIALSAHGVPLTDEWLGRLLSHFEDGHVAGVWGGRTPDAGHSLATRIYRQDLSGFLNDVYSGFSNTNGAIRRALWQIHPFREDLPGTEDKEWAYRVLSSGYVLVYDSTATVLHAHRESLFKRWRRAHRDHAALAGFLSMPPFSARDLLRVAYWEAGGRWRRASGPVAGVRRVTKELPKLLAHEIGRYTGLRTGRRRLPRWSGVERSGQE